MLTENKLQGNKNLHKPKISNLTDISHLKSSLSHHTYKGLVKVVNYLVGMANSYKKVHPSIYSISRGSDLGEDQVIRLLQEGERIGLWTITHRKNFHQSRNKFGIISNLYTLNPLFYDMDWRNSMSSIFTSLKYLPLTVLLITSSIIAQNTYPNLPNSSQSKHAAKYLDYNIYINKQKANRVHAREEFALCTSSTKKEEAKIRERLNMNDTGVLYDNTVFSDAVRRAGRELTMSCAGMCSISSFNDMVINVALKRIDKYSKTIQNPLGLFVSLCNAVSKEMRIPVKHAKAYAIASGFDIKLGKDAAVLEGGNEPRNPKKENIPQWEDKKLSTTANRHLAPTNKALVFPLEEIQLKNPTISIIAVEQISQGIVRIQRHNDTEWRETTPHEREIWKRNEADARMNNPFLQGITVEPPLFSKGDPNFSAFTLYHIDPSGELHSSVSLKVGCKLCDKKIKIC